MAEGISSTTWVDESPLSGNNYYKVKAISAKIESSYSNYAYIQVEYKLEAPTNVTAIFDENLFTVNLNWNAVLRAENYTIYRNSSKIAEGITSTSWTDNAPVAGNNTYSIYAVGHGLTSTSSPSVTYNHVLNAPQNVRATLDDEKLFINLSWDAVKYAESYTIYRNNNNSGNFTKIAEGVTSTSWIDKSPMSGRNYYKISAIGHGLESLTSDVATATKPIPIPNDGVITVKGVSFKMIKVSGGAFMMGKSADNNNVTPVHEVTLSDYYIGETEITQELWEAVMGLNPSSHSGAKYPVDNVSWDDCLDFIKKLNELTNQAFRLPTEAEWEFAAKGGTKSRGYIFSGSNTINDVAWYHSNAYQTGGTHNVATKQPNELGLYDMSGNVEEWCQDCYGDYNNETQTNPTGPIGKNVRVLRGGSYLDGVLDCRSVNRASHNPYYRYISYGLRLAL